MRQQSPLSKTEEGQQRRGGARVYNWDSVGFGERLSIGKSSRFSIRSYRETQVNFLANPIIWPRWPSPRVIGLGLNPSHSGLGFGQWVQSLSRVWLFATSWTTAHQASLSVTDSRSFLKLMSIESVMPSSHLIRCRPLLLLPSTFPSIRVFSSESTLHIRWLNWYN